MPQKHKYIHILTALFICGVALTTLAFNSGQIRKLISGKTGEVAKSAAPVKGELKSAVAGAAPLTAPLIAPLTAMMFQGRSEEHTSELQSLTNILCRLLPDKKKEKDTPARRP